MSVKFSYDWFIRILEIQYLRMAIKGIVKLVGVWSINVASGQGIYTVITQGIILEECFAVEFEVRGWFYFEAPSPIVFKAFIYPVLIGDFHLPFIIYGESLTIMFYLLELSTKTESVGFYLLLVPRSEAFALPYTVERATSKPTLIWIQHPHTNMGHFTNRKVPYE